ncbi:MAG: hypothetical protein JW860_15550, partial [Sedimentisphaerales bacterium]|nr:hypothetical protein [Sedimentisphaerales bacterium]
MSIQMMQKKKMFFDVSAFGKIYYSRLAVLILLLSLASTTSGQIFGDFEGSLENWTGGWDGGTLALSTIGVTSGTQSCKFTPPNVAWSWGIQYDGILDLSAGPLSLDVTWVSSEWISTGSNWVQMNEIYVNSDGASGGVQFGTSYINDPANESYPGSWDPDNWGAEHTRTLQWDLSSYDATGATWMQILISANMSDDYATSSGGTMGSFYLDNVQIEIDLSDLQEYLRITEIMFYPDDPIGGGYTADQIEFIELKNIGDSTLTLDDAAFTAGIEFTFPAGTTLDPNGLILIAKDPCSFALEYPDVPGGVQILGPYTGQLADEGETITLVDNNVAGNIQSFAYSGAWYDETAGEGSSLVIVDYNDSDVDNWAYRSSWGFSSYIGGSPGEDEIVTPPADTVTIDSVTLKANKDRTASKDSFKIVGSGMDMEEADVEDAETGYVDIYNAGESTPIYSEEIDLDLFTGSNGRYRYKGSSGISKFEVDMNNDTFAIDAKNIDLSGLGSPLVVEFELGDYTASGIAAETEEEYLETDYEGTTYPDAINGTKPIPILFLSGEANALQLSKAPKLKQVDTKEDSDSLSIQGGIAAADDSVNLTNEEVVIEWGDYSVTIPAGGLVGANGKYKYKLKDIPSVSVQ